MVKAITPGAPGQVDWLDYDPPTPAPGQVVLQTLACGICATDVKAMRRGYGGGPRYGLGHEVVGRVIAAGAGARWQVGERVVAAPYVPCGLCHYCQAGQPTLCERLYEHNLQPGGLAERILVPQAIAERGLFSVPAALPAEIAALTEPVGCCVHAAEDSGIAPSASVLVVGDGPMGILNAAVARAYGAAPVIVAGLSKARLEIAAAYADTIVNVASEDVAARTKALTGGRGADVVLVAVSSLAALASGLRAVRTGGTLNAFAGVPEGTILSLDVRRLHYGQLRLTGTFGVGPAHLARALDLLASGPLDVGRVISQRFPFADSAAALQHAAEMAGMKAMVLFS